MRFLVNALFAVPKLPLGVVQTVTEALFSNLAEASDDFGAEMFLLVSKNNATYFRQMIPMFAGLELLRLVRRLASPRGASWGVILFLLLPMGMLLRSVLAKEVLVCALFLFVINRTDRMLTGRRASYWQLLMIIPALAILIFIRMMMVYVMALTLGMMFILRSKNLKRLPLVVVIGGLILGVMLLILDWREKIFFRETPLGIFSLEKFHESSSPWAFATSEEESLALKLFWNGDWKRLYLVPIRSVLTLYQPFPPFY